MSHSSSRTGRILTYAIPSLVYIGNRYPSGVNMCGGIPLLSRADFSTTMHPCASSCTKDRIVLPPGIDVDSGTWQMMFSSSSASHTNAPCTILRSFMVWFFMPVMSIYLSVFQGCETCSLTTMPFAPLSSSPPGAVCLSELKLTHSVWVSTLILVGRARVLG